MNPDTGPQTPEQIAAYIDQFADSILVRVRIGDDWRNLSIRDLRALDAAEAERAVGRLIERGIFPHRILVI